jgi:hypothetical protein
VIRFVRPVAALVLALVVWAPAAPVAAADGQLVWAVHVTIASRWLDPGETESAITPFMVLYALHDALVKPMPAGPATPSLAESWTMSPDGRAWPPAPAWNRMAWCRRSRTCPSARRARWTAASARSCCTRSAPLYDRVVFAPVWENALIRGYGPRVEESALTLVPSYPYSAPYEELRLKAR